MKKSKHFIQSLFFVILVIIIGCKKDPPIVLPVVNTLSITDVTLTSAISGGSVQSDGNSPVIARGVCWSINENPTISDNKTSDGTGTGPFVSNLTNLIENTSYYVRAYATNIVGTSYGQTLVFKTIDENLLINAEQMYPGLKGEEVTAILNGKSIICILINNLYIYQGDILIPIEITKGFSSTDIQKWPDNTVYYKIRLSPGMTPILLNAIDEAINEYENKTNLIFKERVNEPYYVEFTYDPNGSGGVPGMRTREYQIGKDPTVYDHNIIILASWARHGTVLHEIGHTIGLLHEHTKPNRDDYIKVIDENIKEEFQSQFKKDEGNIISPGFDWESIMLYPSVSDFSIGGRATMLRIIGDKRIEFESNREYLSESDINTINVMYPAKPKVTTTSVISITSNSATCNGEVLNDGGWNVYERGVCWSTNQSPSIENNKLSSGIGIGNYSCDITDLNPNTTYYIRAYAINGSGIGPGYGEALSFKTLEALKPPSVSTAEPSEIKSNSAKIGGNVTSDGGATVTEKGIYYSTNIVSNGTKLQIGSGSGVFSTTLTGLTPNTTYYVKAYATNSIGTSYGSILSLKTDITAQSPSVTTSAPTNITSNSANLGGNVTSAGSSPVLERGVVYSTTQNPTTSNTKIASGSGIGAYTVNATSLNANTTYYVRAYAINSNGTGYGTEQNFITETAGVAPVAAFTANTTTIKEGESVQFTDQSTNNPTSWSWDFGDGSKSSAQNPSHTYTNVGKFTVKLTITNSRGSNSITKNDYIIVNSASGVLFNPDLTYGSMTDIEGNIYKTIQIGNQIWMAENLRTTKLNNGVAINNFTNNALWQSATSPSYCWYNNDLTNKSTYGALYNKYAVDTDKLCPLGWHVSTDNNWSIMVKLLGGDDIAASKLKESGSAHWANQNEGATNSSGFTALPGGMRRTDTGVFSDLNKSGFWWCINPENYAFSSWNRQMHFNENYVERYGLISYNNKYGLSVRCVKN